MENAHALETAEVVQKLGSDFSGLSDEESLHRLHEYGPNELAEKGRKNPWKILWDQISSAMVGILLAAAGISVVVGDFKNAATIAAIVILNAILGFIQEYKAEKAMAALKKLTVPQVRVQRRSGVKKISARELVPGDVIFLEAGNAVPADARILESFNLKNQEAALTGESEPVLKEAGILEEKFLLPERRNMVYMGTITVAGRGKAVVTATGMRTELGKIADLIQHAEPDPTPLQKRLAGLGKQLTLAALAIIAVIFALGILRGEDFRLMFLTAVSMAVAAVPEGIPAVVTISLALGAQRMLKKNALIRKLPAVETLGSVTVICSDKTGTLTENKMTVVVLDGAGGRLDLTEHFRLNEPCLQPDGRKASPLLKKHTGFHLLLRAAVLCNDASPVSANENPLESGSCLAGDPTETALVIAAARIGIWKENLDKLFPRIDEIPFDSNRKAMATLHEIKECIAPVNIISSEARDLGKRGTSGFLQASPVEMTPRELEPCVKKIPFVIFVKGACETLLPRANRIWIQEKEELLTPVWRAQINQAQDELTKNGMRVLAVAMRPLEAAPQKEHWEEDLIFIGLIGMIDPARSEVRQAVAVCRKAGIRPVMITGDHPHTAQAIARQLGISAEAVLTGREIELMPAASFERAVEQVGVYARVSPEHKLKIIEALKKKGHIVAMTGDGVNDAPALKKSDIGIAMGVTGTDVSKEASDMVLLDDNFATIVAAVEEGRVIYDNIRRFVKYLVTTNLAEIFVMLAAPFLGMPLPLWPLQILWINLVTDGPVALALGVEPAESNVMRRPPVVPGESLFNRRMLFDIVWPAAAMSVLSIGAGYFLWKENQGSWQTMVFTTLAWVQMGQALALRSSGSSILNKKKIASPGLLAAVALTIILQIMVVYVPALQSIFKTVPLNFYEIAVCAALSAVIFFALEIRKLINGFFLGDVISSEARDPGKIKTARFLRLRRSK